MTTKYLDGAGLKYFHDNYVLTATQVNALIQTAFAQYKQDVFTVVSALQFEIYRSLCGRVYVS